MKVLLITTAASAAFATTAAMAGNLTPAAPEPVVQAPPAPVAVTNYDWTGAYGGVALGYGNINPEGGGIVGGLTGGYDWDFGNYVLGVGLDYNLTDMALTTAELDALGRARVRAGYDMGNWLIYGTGGAAYGDGLVAGVSGDDWGWFAGGGAEYRVNENVSVGGEVIYHKFDDFNGTGSQLDVTTAQARVTYRF